MSLLERIRTIQRTSIFGHFAGKAFDHSYGVARTGEDEIELALFELAVCWHQDEFAVDKTDANRSSNFQKRNLREMERGAGANNRQNVRVVLLKPPCSP